MRILLLPPTAWQPYRENYAAGTGPNPFEIYERLTSEGIETKLIDPHRKPLNPLAGRNSLLESFDPLRAFGVMLGERRADLVLSVFEGGSACILLLRRLLGFKAPVVLWDIGLTETWALRKRTLDFVVPKVDGILVLSASQKAYIQRQWGAQTDVEVIGHHVDTEFFSPSTTNTDGPIISVGDDAGRDFDCLMEATETLQTEMILKTRRPMSAEIGRRNIKIIRDRITYVELRNLYAKSRFVVAPLQSTLNANGVSTILEAGAMGKALIVSDSASIRDFIVPDETCLVVPCGDRQALRKAIDRLIAEPETCERIGRNARRFIEATCSRPVFADRLAKAVRHFAHPNDPRSRRA